MPRLGEAGPAIEAEEAELDQTLEPVADEELIERRESGRDAEEFRLENAFAGRAMIERVEHHTAGATFREWQLIFVDEPAFHREGDEDANEGEDHHPDHHVPPRHDHAGDHHVSGEAGDEGDRHVTGRGRDRLHGVVFQNREVLCHPEAREGAEQDEGEDDRGEVDAEGDAGLAADVEIGRGKNPAEEKAGQPGAKGELREVAAENVLEPPAVLLLPRPGAGLFIGEMCECHDFL